MRSVHDPQSHGQLPWKSSFVFLSSVQLMAFFVVTMTGTLQQTQRDALNECFRGTVLFLPSVQLGPEQTRIALLMDEFCDAVKPKDRCLLAKAIAHHSFRKPFWEATWRTDVIVRLLTECPDDQQRKEAIDNIIVTALVPRWLQSVPNPEQLVVRESLKNHRVQALRFIQCLCDLKAPRDNDGHVGALRSSAAGGIASRLTDDMIEILTSSIRELPADSRGELNPLIGKEKMDFFFCTPRELGVDSLPFQSLSSALLLLAQQWVPAADSRDLPLNRLKLTDPARQGVRNCLSSLGALLKAETRHSALARNLGFTDSTDVI